MCARVKRIIVSTNKITTLLVYKRQIYNKKQRDNSINRLCLESSSYESSITHSNAKLEMKYKVKGK